MRIPIISALNDLLESRATQARVTSQTHRLIESTLDNYIDQEDDSQWTTLYRAGQYVSQWQTKLNTTDYHAELRSKARYLARFEALARSVLQNYIRFLWGTGPTVVPNDDNPAVAEWWWAFESEQSFFRFGAKLIFDLFRDGEVFIYDRMEERKTPRFVLLPPESIISPPGSAGDPSWLSGINFESNDITQIRGYNYQVHGRDQFIRAEFINHVKINHDENEVRGRSILEATIQDFDDYRTYRKNRARLNHIRSLFAIVRYVPGSPSQVRSASNALKPGASSLIDSAGQEKSRQLKSGTIITTNVPDSIQTIAPNLQAADAQHDGRMIQLAIAAGQGQSETWLTADSQNANYASAAVAESPAIVQMQFWQRYIKEQVIDWMFKRVVLAGISQGVVPERAPQVIVVNGVETTEMRDTDLTCTVDFPTLIHRDLNKEADALCKLIDKKVLDNRTVANQLGYDYDKVLENRMRDPEVEVAPASLPFQGGNPPNYESLFQGTKTLAQNVRALVESIRRGRHV